MFAALGFWFLFFSQTIAQSLWFFSFFAISFLCFSLLFLLISYHTLLLLIQLFFIYLFLSTSQEVVPLQGWFNEVALFSWFVFIFVSPSTLHFLVSGLLLPRISLFNDSCLTRL
ncbi:hypothetical protein NC651_009077 [Populus alba x Populus x berolinensis]|nr:hypothetical protein NC651_009077 [Populus alba x Populus x berolinensis]